MFWSCSALVNKLVPCAWLLSGALEVWSLRLRLRLRFPPTKGVFDRFPPSRSSGLCKYHTLVRYGVTDTMTYRTSTRESGTPSNLTHRLPNKKPFINVKKNLRIIIE